jgi:hypothetical protein
MDWHPDNDLLDPTCGTGTFLLEAIKRRLVAAGANACALSARDVLAGVYGIDLNPLAVLAAKASIVVVLASRLQPDDPITIPVFLADAINSATPSEDGFFVHTIQTELGLKRFEVPSSLVQSEHLYPVFESLRQLITAGADTTKIMKALGVRLTQLTWNSKEEARFAATVDVLIDLHRKSWDGIWCPILADRFSAGAIEKVSHIAGNPPWVKWSHLPAQYASFIKPLCQEMNVFSRDRYVGGIESDISTVITFRAILKWLAEGGKLGFFITATVFANESSQGFRRFETHDGQPIAGILEVEDYKAVAPFDGVTNHPAFLMVEQGKRTAYPVRYRVWTPAEGAEVT